MPLASILIAWLLADFITGHVHWYEERYMAGPYKSKVIQGIYEDNRMHHIKPTAMLRYSWFGNIKFSLYITIPASIILFLLNFHAVVWLSVFFAGFGNLVHRFSHMPNDKLPLWIRVFQATGIFITKTHHDGHHRHDGHLILKEQSTIRYCPMTNLVNPLLDFLHYWDFLEWVLGLFGKKPVPIPVRVK